MRNIYFFVEVTSAGKEILFDGMEYAKPLVNAMDLDYLERVEDSLGRLLKELRHKFQEWERAEQNQSPA